MISSRTPRAMRLETAGCHSPGGDALKLDRGTGVVGHVGVWPLRKPHECGADAALARAAPPPSPSGATRVGRAGGVTAGAAPAPRRRQNALTLPCSCHVQNWCRVKVARQERVPNSTRTTDVRYANSGYRHQPQGVSTTLAVRSADGSTPHRSPAHDNHLPRSCRARQGAARRRSRRAVWGLGVVAGGRYQHSPRPQRVVTQVCLVLPLALSSSTQYPCRAPLADRTYFPSYTTGSSLHAACTQPFHDGSTPAVT